jgi:hypothetical protein
MFWIESKSLASAKKQTTYGPASRLSILTEMPLEVIFHTVEVNHHSICRCVGAVYASRQNCIVLYTYITKPDSIYTSAGFVQASTQTILCYTHYTMQFPYGNIFPITGKPYRACQCEVTGASSWLCTKDSSLKCCEYFVGQHDYKLKIKKTGVWIASGVEGW